MRIAYFIISLIHLVAFGEVFGQVQRDAAVEICNNGIDDDGNGLTDCSDYNCYFQTGGSSCTCAPINIVWIATADGSLFWKDLLTGNEKLVGNIGNNITDISWTNYGKLYGISNEANGLTIWNIDVEDGISNVNNILLGYNMATAMTADLYNQIYFVATEIATNTRFILRHNVVDGQLIKIANLSNAGISITGDLAFIDGFLYGVSTNNSIAKIDVNSGAVQTFSITGLPVGTNITAILSIAAGSVYMGAAGELYKLDISTMQATPAFTIATSSAQIIGMAGYNEGCQAPPDICRVNIEIVGTQPYCEAGGVILIPHGSAWATGGGLEYNWTFPDGKVVKAYSVTGKQSGMYKVKLQVVPDGCIAEDSVLVSFYPSPNPRLGNDTFFCAGGQVVLQSSDNNNVDSYLWQDNSTAPQLVATQPGIYWLELKNKCTVLRDSIKINVLNKPQVKLGNDTIICSGDILALANLSVKQPADQYTWIDGSTKEVLPVSKEDLYWLRSNNICGMAADSIDVKVFDTCKCVPLIAKAELGSNREICERDTIHLVNQLHESYFRYRWSNGSTNKDLIIDKPGKYWVTVSTWCNTVSDTITITARNKEDCICKMNVPNAFSPNGDNNNDLFKVLYNCNATGEFRIYNRWGQMVFQTTDLKKGWDGTVSGKLQQTGFFVYYLKYSFANQTEIFSQKGVVQLLR